MDMKILNTDCVLMKNVTLQNKSKKKLSIYEEFSFLYNITNMFFKA